MFLNVQSLHGEKLTEILKTIAANETKVDISSNELCNFSETKLKEVFSSFPLTTVDVNLGHNNLGYMRSNILAAALVGLVQIEKLGLEKNDFGFMKSEEFAEILTALTKNLKELNLFGNYLNKLDKALPTVLATCPQSLESIDLSWNALGQLKSETLSKVFVAFHKTNLKRIDLSYNELYKLDKKELMQAFANIPYGTEFVNLRGNGLKKKYNESELTTLLNELPNTVEKIRIGKESFLTNSGFFATPKEINSSALPLTVNNSMNFK